MNDVDKIISTIERVSDKFNSTLSNTEKILLDEVLNLVKELSTANGRVNSSVENLKKLSKIKAKLSRIASDKNYLKTVKELVNGMGSIADSQMQYFSNFGAVKNKEKYKLVQQMSVDSIVQGLTRTGIESNVTSKITDIIQRSITSGGMYADLVKEMSNFLTSNENGDGALKKYAQTWVNTSLNQFAGQNNKLLTDDLGLEWFMYVGSNKETTREFCEHLRKKKYVHKSELSEIIKGNIDGHQCEIYERTGLPKGMIEGTTVDNFQINNGGWNCGHKLTPVSKEAVPKEVIERFEHTQSHRILVKSGNEVAKEDGVKLEETIKKLTDKKIEYNDVKLLDSQLSEEKIISRVGGGDLTKGSCSSLSFAYAGNKLGFDVLDFRDGESRSFFATKGNIINIAEKANGFIEKDYSDFKAVNKLVANMKEGKEYILITGGHSSVVRKIKDKDYQYLELQSPTSNGYKPLTKTSLKERFGCKKSRTSYGQKLTSSSILIDIEELNNNSFRKMLGYINTAESKQSKGMKGKMK